MTVPKPDQPPRHTLPVAAADPAEETSCPFCGETIKRIARKCKHCGEFLDARLRAMQEPVHDSRRRSSSLVRLAAVGCLIALLICYLNFREDFAKPSAETHDVDATQSVKTDNPSGADLAFRPFPPGPLGLIQLLAMSGAAAQNLAAI
jgi:hypothetical protein